MKRKERGERSDFKQIKLQLIPSLLKEYGPHALPEITSKACTVLGQFKD